MDQAIANNSAERSHPTTIFMQQVERYHHQRAILERPGGSLNTSTFSQNSIRATLTVNNLIAQESDLHQPLQSTIDIRPILTDLFH